MSATNKSRSVRQRLIEALRRELMGPSESQETIPEFPTTRYIVGRLAPARAGENDTDAKIDETENDSTGVVTREGEEGDEDTLPPLIIGFNPSSMGLSFLIDASVRELRIHVAWGDYLNERGSEQGPTWHRYPRNGVVDRLPVGTTGTIPRTLLSPSSANAPGIQVSGVDDPEIALEGVVHDFAGYRAVSLFLVNRRTKGKSGDRSKDERWIYQPRLTVTTADSAPVFVAKDFRVDPLPADDHGEAAINALLYRHAREFATGHGVAAGWDAPTEGEWRTTAVYTEFIPSHEVPMLIPPSEETGDATLDMKKLAKAETPEELSQYLKPMVDAYEVWVDGTTQASMAADIQGDAELRNAAKQNLEQCRECATRIRSGLDLLKQRHVFAAFRFANAVMWDQRVHSIWAAANRKRGKVEGSAADFDKPHNRTWRPFQIGFLLLNLLGIVDETSMDRRLVDLLWFPTGGGKTEAYLGLAAFTLALRRLRGDRYGMHAGAGVSIIMRYTLRLLTVQQFQRAAALICACELSRRSDVVRWGKEIFRIGVWVGSGTTPNTFSDSQKALEDLREGKFPRRAARFNWSHAPGVVRAWPTKRAFLESRLIFLTPKGSARSSGAPTQAASSLRSSPAMRGFQWSW